jgi:hypothetical protein
MLQWKVVLTLAAALVVTAVGGNLDWLRTFGW